MAKMEEPTSRVVDPICGKALPRRALPTSEYKKKKYYFCSEKCRRDFERQKERLRLNDMAKVGSLFTPGKVRWGMA